MGAVRVSITENDVEVRVARLESDVAHIRSDISEMKADVRQLRGEIGGLRGELRELKDYVVASNEKHHQRFTAIEGRISSMQVWALLLYITFAASLLGVLARGFHWI